MTATYHSLLDERLITVRRKEDEVVEATLPEVLAWLECNEVAAFENLQAHQKQPWFCFLVQVAAMAIARHGQRNEQRNAERWKELLLAMSSDVREAWCVVVNDLSKPAFMQPPVPEGSLEEAGYDPDVPRPDDPNLDILSTTKNHDVKKQGIHHPAVEHWVFALITLQTLQGYSGRYNYGVVRMNGGSSSRPFVDISSALSWGRRFEDDVKTLIEGRSDIVDQFDYSSDGHALLWTLPWDGSKDSGLSITDCDPYFLEVCRRFRLALEDGKLIGWRTSTKATRIAGYKELNGVTGDPWTPVAKEGKALTLSEQGFHYRLLQEILLSEDWVPGIAMDPARGPADGGYLLAACLVRGQGKTDGFFERIIPVPPHIPPLFGDPDDRQRLFSRAGARVELAGDVRSRVLYPALRALLAGGDDKNVDSSRLNRWTNAFDGAVDAVFFQELWGAVDQPEANAVRRWQDVLFRLARTHFEDAIESAPLPSARRYRAISRAEAIFYGSARRRLPRIFQDQRRTDDQ